MLVKGHEVTEGQIAEALQAVRHSPFRLLSLAAAMGNQGVEWEACDRAADRVMQKMRREGKAVVEKGRWRLTA